MTLPESDGLLVFFTAIATSIITWLLSRKKKHAETDQIELGNVTKMIAIYEKTATSLAKQVDVLQKQVCNLTKEMQQLRTENQLLRSEITKLKAAADQTNSSQIQDAIANVNANVLENACAIHTVDLLIPRPDPLPQKKKPPRRNHERINTPPSQKHHK